MSADDAIAEKISVLKYIVRPRGGSGEGYKMNIYDILLLAVALSMDAVAVSMTNGMTDPKSSLKRSLLPAFLFGLFQAAMPLIGYYITEVVSGAFQEKFQSVSAWVAFILLAFIGGKMIIDSIKERKKEHSADETTEMEKKTLSVGEMFVQAVATSIDALAVGISLKMAAMGEGLFPAIGYSVTIIGCTTFLLSAIATKIGKMIGNKLADKAEILGGIVLIGIGLKILISSFF